MYRIRGEVQRPTLSMMYWKCTLTRAVSRLRKLVDLWMSSDTLFRRSCTDAKSLALPSYRATQSACQAATKCMPAHLLCALAKDKEHGVDDVGLATAVWPHHRREALQMSHILLGCRVFIHTLRV